MVDQNTMGAPEVNREFDIFQAFVCINSMWTKIGEVSRWTSMRAHGFLINPSLKVP